MQLRAKQKRISNIPTASMGDIAFLIIIFFMTSTVFSREKGIKMLLPEKTQESDIVKIKPENIVMISINPAGELHVKIDGRDEYLPPEHYDGVKDIIERKLLERDTLLVVSLRTSRETSYKHMIAVLDQVKLAQVVMPDGREVRARKISLVPTSETSEE